MKRARDPRSVRAGANHGLLAPHMPAQKVSPMGEEDPREAKTPIRRVHAGDCICAECADVRDDAARWRWCVEHRHFPHPLIATVSGAPERGWAYSKNRGFPALQFDEADTAVDHFRCFVPTVSANGEKS